MTLRVSLLAAILAFLPFQGALAQNDSPDPAEIARHCVRAVNATTARALGAIGDTTDATLTRIRRLDASGAADREIVAAGHAGATRVSRIAEFAGDSIQTLTRRCAAAMVAAGAERQMVARVIGFSDDAQAGIDAAAERARAAIAAAVRRAIG